MLKIFAILAISISVTCTVLATNTDAMKITIWNPGVGSIALNAPTYVVQLDGFIDPEAPIRLRSQLQPLKGKLISYYLNSSGGSLSSGMELGRIIRQTGLSSQIGIYAGEQNKTISGICYSACSLAYLGGSFRYIEEKSEFGMHRFSATTTSSRDLEIRQIVLAEVAAYIREMDVSPRLLDLMAKTSKDEIYILTKKQLAELNVTNNGRLPPKWTIEAAEVGMYLRGEQETYLGLAKAIFFCDQDVIFNSLAPINKDQAPSMVKGDWVHSLLIDSDLLPIKAKKIKYDGYFLHTYFILTPEQVKRVITAKTIGHAIQPSRKSYVYVGYEIEVPEDQRQKIQNFLRNCQKH